MSIQQDFFIYIYKFTYIYIYIWYKNAVCSVLIGLGRTEMWKTVIWHINGPIFVFSFFFFCNVHKYLSAIMLEIEFRLS